MVLAVIDGLNLLGKIFHYHKGISMLFRESFGPKLRCSVAWQIGYTYNDMDAMIDRN